MGEGRDETGLVQAVRWKPRTRAAVFHSTRAGAALLNGGKRKTSGRRGQREHRRCRC